MCKYSKCLTVSLSHTDTHTDTHTHTNTHTHTHTHTHNRKTQYQFYGVCVQVTSAGCYRGSRVAWDDTWCALMRTIQTLITSEVAGQGITAACSSFRLSQGFHRSTPGIKAPATALSTAPRSSVPRLSAPVRYTSRV